MANVKISNLPAAADIVSSDVLPVVDDGTTTTKKATFQQVLDYVTGSTFNELTVYGDTTLGNTDADKVQFVADVSSSILPSDDAAFDLGAPASQWKDLYLSQDATVAGDVSASNFYGDGSGITGVTAEWDGSHTGNASITGSLFVTQTISGSTITGSTIEATDITVYDGTISNNLQVDNGVGVGMSPASAGTVRANGTGAFQAKKGGYDNIAFLAQPLGLGHAHYLGFGMAAQDEARITAASDAASIGNNLTFYTGDTAGVEAEKMRITTSGEVGIGTSTPAAKLDVSGSLIADVALSGAVGSEIASTSYSLSADDRGKTLLFSSSTTQGITCSSGLSVGYNTTFIQLGSGQLELSASVGVSLLNRQSHIKTAGLYAAATVVIISSDTYLLSGDTSS